MGSHTQYPEAVAVEFGQSLTPFTGQAFSMIYNHGARNWNWSGYVDGLSPAFRADAGFVPQVEKRMYSAGAGRTFIGSADKWFNEMSVNASCDRTTDWRNERAR